MNPFKGASRRCCKHKVKSTEVQIKQEPLVKEECDEGIVIEVSQPGDDRSSIANYGGSYDFESDFDETKVKIKCEGEKTDKEKESAPSERPNDLPNDDGNVNRIGDAANVQTSSQAGSGKERNVTAKKPNKRMAEKQQKHKCHVCNHLASCKAKLIRHLRTHTGEKPFQCDVCLKSFSQKSDLNRHKKKHGQFRCTKCGDGFEQDSIKNDHEQQCSPPQFKCDICGYKSKKKVNLESHMRIHTEEKTFVCSICFKSFAIRYNLQSHSKTHKNELPHACLKCGQRFATPNDKHTHENRCQRNLHACKQCHYKTSWKNHLKQHMQSKHGAKRSIKCGICSKEFVQQLRLNQHLSLAHGNRFPFKCSKCFGGFASEGEKVAHEDNCGHRQYECYLCKQNRRDFRELKAHMRKLHGGKRIPCKVCGAGFIWNSDARKHMKNVHRLMK